MILSKKLAMVAMVSGLGLTAAHAADIPSRHNSPTVVAPISIVTPAEFSFTGFHLGVNGGGVKFHKGKKTDTPDSVKHPMAGIGGVQAGYDHQFGQFVLGLEGDANFSAGPVAKTGPVKASLEQLYTVRARAGYAVDRTLVYATGGWANMTLKPNKFAKSLGAKSVTRNGWTVGGGLEYALTDNISARGEYLYVSMPKDTTEKLSKSNFSVVRAGLNFKF